MSEDGAEPLSDARRELFCNELAKGLTKQKAAVKAGFPPKSAHVTASRLLKEPKILNRIAWIKKEAARRTTITLAEGTEALLRIADAGEALKHAPGLAVARASIVSAMEAHGLITHKSEHIHERRIPDDQLDAVLDALDRELARREREGASPEADEPAARVHTVQ